MSAPTGKPRTGVWIIGVKGGVATTAICGALAISRGMAGSHGMITTSDLFAGVELPPLENLIFAGHDVRTSTLVENAEQIYQETRTLSYELLAEIRPELERIDEGIRPGILFQSGKAIESLADDARALETGNAPDALAQIEADLEEFQAAHQLDELVVINLASTEPAPVAHPGHASADGIESLIAGEEPQALIASTLYATAAARQGAAYVNFTPSPGALLGGVAEMFTRAGLPFMGSDGKTGETLVKSALAPMFKYRNLRVLSWQGYNMLGDRDGEVLAEDENKATKVASKDNLLHRYLGYPLHSKVAIDYVPSLGDFKTAWDFIHFQGFLDFKMSLQFTWQGCDSILAAPIALDLVRLIALARRRGEAGPQVQLSVFFKNPHGVEEHDLHFQFHQLLEYISGLRSSGD